MRLFTTLIVTTPADTYDLTDLATVKQELDINTTDNDDLLNRWITQASRRIQKYCDRVFSAEGVTETFRTNAGVNASVAQFRSAIAYPNGAKSLELRRRPIVSIDSIVEDNTRTLVADVDYTYDIEAGIIYRLYNTGTTNWPLFSKVVVEYTGGFDPIPDDVVEACLLYLRKRWAERGRDPTLRQITIEGVGSKTYWVSTPTTSDPRNTDADLTPEVTAKLIDYRGYSFA